MKTKIYFTNGNKALIISMDRKPVLQTLEIINHFLKKGYELIRVNW